MTDIKEAADKAWPLFGYAPGDYMCECVVCNQVFVGDKRAVNCLECAARAANKRLASPPSPAPAESGAVAALLGNEDDLHSVAHALDIGSIGAPYRAYQGSVYCDYQSHRIADFQDYGLAMAATVLFNNAKAIKAAIASWPRQESEDGR